MKIILLREEHRSDLKTLLMNNISANLYLIELLQTNPIRLTPMLEWIGVFEDEKLIAMTCALGRTKKKSQARLLMIHGQAEGAEFLGRYDIIHGGTRLLIGERDCTDAYWKGMKSPKPKLWYNQRIYTCKTPSSGGTIPIIAARKHHYDAVYLMSAEMMLADLGEDPRMDEVHHSRTVHNRIRQGRSWVSEVDGKIQFLIDIGTKTQLGAQVGGTFVPLELRNQGLATRGMRTVCQKLLSTCERVSLHVNEANSPAVQCYEQSGFVRSTPYRLIALPQ